MTITVAATGNHFFLDAAAGLLVAAATIVLVAKRAAVRALLARCVARARRSQPSVEAPAPVLFLHAPRTARRYPDADVVPLEEAA